MCNQIKTFLVIFNCINFLSCSFSNHKDMFENKKTRYLHLINKQNPLIENGMINNKKLYNNKKKEKKTLRKLYNFCCCIDPLGNNRKIIECSASLFICSIYSVLLIYFSYLYSFKKTNWKWIGCDKRNIWK